VACAHSAGAWYRSWPRTRHRQLAAQHRDGGPAVILISTYSAADFARPIAESPATAFLPKQELSADAIRRIVDGRGPAGPPGAAAR